MKNVLVFVLVGLFAFVYLGRQVVSGGTYTLRSGQTVTGDLMISGGSSILEPGSRVTGALWVTGGSLKANGQIDGDVLVTGGSVAFGSSAVVRGPVRMTGGGIQVAEGANIQPTQSYIMHPPAAVQAFLDSDAWHSTWPVAILLAGIICLGAVRMDGRRLSGLAIPGSVLLVLGLLSLFQNTFNQFQTWAYAWLLLIPTSVGLGLCIQGVAIDQDSLRERGKKIARIGLIAFLVLAAFFELIINLSGLVRGDSGWVASSALLVAMGVLLVLGIVRNRVMSGVTG